MLFNLANINYEFDKPLTPKILSDPTHEAVKHLMYIYSMQTFIYEDLNRVCREKDRSKIKFYGALAAVLSFIINSANKNRLEHKLEKSTTLFRGLKLTQDEVDQFEKGNTTNLLGYTSTSMLYDIALKFAFEKCKDYQVPVVFEIVIKGSSGIF